jgi:hypothetical protein
MWIRLPTQNASNPHSSRFVRGRYWYLKLVILAACVICVAAKIRSEVMAQPIQQGSSSEQIPQPVAVPANLTARDLSARDIATQILHRTLLESVWGEPAHCTIRQSIQMFDKKRSSFGNYVRSGKGLGKLRLTLQVPAGDQMNSVLQISDGELLTTYESIGSQSMMTQIDLGKVHERLVINKETLQDPVIAMYLAIGGQAEELRRICQKYEWSKVTEGQLGDQKVWWIRGNVTAQPPQKHAKALVDVRLFEQPYDTEIPPNIKLAIGHTDSVFPFWLYQVEKWNDGDSQGRNKLYVLTEWDNPARLLPGQVTPDLFRLSADQSLNEIREETKLYLPPPPVNVATRPRKQR